MSKFGFKTALLLFLTLSQSSIGQNTEVDIENKITKIQQKLNLLKTKLNKAYGKEQQLIGKLEEQDKEINKVAKNVSISKSQLKIIQTQISQLNQNISNKSNSIEAQKNQVVDLLKLQLYMNHDKTLKMLLVNPSNKSNNQAKHQIKYLQNKLYNLIKVVANEIKLLKALKQEQLLLQDEENTKQQLLLSQQDNLLGKRNQRLNILKSLKVEIAKHETESDGLNKDQKRLNQLLLEIKNLLSDLPVNLGSNAPFSKLRNKMLKPVKGSYIRSFHSRRSEDTRWNGVVIKAKVGDPVNAIAYGRVAFADWLRGFGMLVIVDHQDGYMSLYGFNESINVEVGDWVDSRQEIATVGNSGTLVTSAVYFEIRKDAKPLNPKSWVK